MKVRIWYNGIANQAVGELTKETDEYYELGGQLRIPKKDVTPGGFEVLPEDYGDGETQSGMGRVDD